MICQWVRMHAKNSVYQALTLDKAPGYEARVLIRVTSLCNNYSSCCNVEFTSTHSVEPIYGYSSASQLHSTRVLPGRQSGNKQTNKQTYCLMNETLTDSHTACTGISMAKVHSVWPTTDMPCNMKALQWIPCQNLQSKEVKVEIDQSDMQR